MTSAPVAPASADAPPFRYTPALAGKIEQHWQDRWEADGTFYTPNPKGPLSETGHHTHDGRDINQVGQPFFVMDMFPYPSGAGLHVGHPLGYIATDVVGRYRRMRGDNVLHAMGYDAFGLPAEQFAVATGQHPRISTEANIATMRRQLRRIGLAHDPRRTFTTIDPEYIRWTQWIFLQIFNSWYDPDAIWQDADGGEHRGKARPISELRAAYADGTKPLPTGFEGKTWALLTPDEQREIIDGQRLAYSDSSPVNWAPGLGTVLANEEVINGRSERGNMPVFKKALRQWKMRITAYADRLADDLDLVDWPDSVKHMQRNWIGRSTGAYVKFDVVSTNPPTAGTRPTDSSLEVFTTRPDTLFGATFMVVAPEHELLDHLPAQWPANTPAAWTGGAATPTAAVTAYRAQAATKTDEDRMGETAEKTGVFSGCYARNPLTGTDLPIFVADYVLMGYGTGAIMAVPGGDARDYAFAKRYELPVIYTVVPDPDAPNQGLPDGFDDAWTEDGVVVNSAPTSAVPGAPNLNGMDIATAKQTATDWLAERGLGSSATTYRLRDWLFSRQRYWGEPFPIVWDENDHPIALPAAMLPIELPDVPDYAPRTFDPDDADSEPEAPLGRNPEWVNVQLDLGDGVKNYRRDTNTMPNWAGSCWYYLRYLDPDWNDATVVVDPELDRYWIGPHHNDSSNVAGGVDLYVGGVEHAVLHLLYARFWQKVLYDLGFSSALEPFGRLFNQGYIQAFAFTDARGAYVPASEVSGNEVDGFIWNGEPVNREYGKMGKSLKNIVTPDEMYADYGADTFRLYEMSMGPLDLSRPWNTRDVVGAQRFLQRVWRNVVNEETGATEVSEAPADEETRRIVNRTIEDVRTEMDGMRPNTAIAKLIQLNNHLTGVHPVPREAIEPLVLMLAPFAPHLAEELWARLGHQESLTYHPYPVADPAYLVEETVTCILQVKGKVRSRIEVPPSISEADLEAAALADEGLQRAIAGKEIRKVIVRAPNVVNVVI